MSRSVRNLLLIFLVIAVLLTLKFICAKPKEQKSPQAAGKQPAAVKVYVAKAQQLSEYIRLSGNIKAANSIELRSELTGRVEKILFTDGSQVKKGQILVKLRDTDLAAKLKVLKAQENILKSRLERQQKLKEIDAVSKEELEDAQLTYESVHAEIEAVRLNIEKSELRAPFDGVVGLRSISEGAMISPSTLICTLENKTRLFVDFAVPEAYAHLIQKGQQLRFTAGNSLDTIAASVEAIDPSVDASTRTLMARAIYSNSASNVVSGTFANVFLHIKGRPDAIVIPTEALIPDLKSYRVFIARNGKAESVIVQPGLRTVRYVEILTGIEAGDSVINSGIMQLKAGSPLKVLKSN